MGAGMCDLGTYQVELGPETPVINMRTDTAYSGPLNMRMALVSDAMVLFTVNQAEVRSIITESIGVIVTAVVQPYAADAREAQIRLELANFGELTTNYVLSVSDCSANIEPGVFFQIVSLAANHGYRHEMLFDVKTDTAFAAGDTCRVRLRAPTGRLYDDVTVTFPAPS